MKLIAHADALPMMREKYGPLYVKGIIPFKTYPGQNVEVPITVVWNLLVCNEKMKGDVVYDILKTVFDHKQELVASHREASNLSLEYQTGGGSPIAFHPGAIRYFQRKELRLNN